MSRLDELRARLPEMTEDLGELVGRESPSSDAFACVACADTVSALGKRLIGVAPDVMQEGGRPALVWRFGPATRVLLIGHIDTVWPLGTTERWPFAARDGLATGPGIFDMKSGIVLGLFALSTLDSLEGVSIVLNSDEELGSLESRDLIEREAAGARAALVLEPAAGTALKVARKGVSVYDLDATGRAAHAGLEPERGINATVELAHHILAVQDIARAAVGTTVTPTLLTGGTAQNTVPASATVHIDVRASTTTEQQRVDSELRRLRPVVPGASIALRGGPNRPPLEESSSRELYALACRLAEEIGIDVPGAARVGGGSDGNFTAGIGVPTLDGLGAVGDGAHAEGEHVVLASLPERAALLAALVEELLS